MKVTKKEFRAWLESKDPKANVGRVGNTGWCPVARYLRENGEKKVFVSPWYYRTATQYHGTSNWLRNFISYIDSLDSSFSRRSKVRVSASRALKVLARSSHPFDPFNKPRV